MTESETQRAARLDDALAESQRQEREELDAAMARQRAADERIVQALQAQTDQNEPAAPAEGESPDKPER